MRYINNLSIAVAAAAIGSLAAVAAPSIIGFAGVAGGFGLAVGIAAWLGLQWAKERLGR